MPVTPAQVSEADRVIRQSVCKFAPRLGVDAEDAGQDAWLAVLEDLCRRPERTVTPGWFCAVARNSTVSLARRKAIVSGVPLDHEIPDATTPESLALLAEGEALARTAVRAVVDVLSNRDRSMVSAMLAADGDILAAGTAVQRHRLRRRLAANDTILAAVA